jgi:uncharacterized protein with FMN-binding domain
MADTQTTTGEASNNNLKKGVVGILSLSVIVAIGAYLAQDKKEVAMENSQPVANKTDGTKVLQVGTTSEAKPSVYKNGVYAAKGSYASPAGGETVDITLTVVGDTITNATFKGEATNPASVNWQGKFSQGFTQVVVGKKVDELSLSVVNGASLTPKGFMDAVSKIKVQAKG